MLFTSQFSLRPAPFKVLDNLPFQSSWESVAELAGDERHLGRRYSASVPFSASELPHVCGPPEPLGKKACREVCGSPSKGVPDAIYQDAALAKNRPQMPGRAGNTQCPGKSSTSLPGG